MTKSKTYNSAALKAVHIDACIAERFKPTTVLWTFHTIQPFSFDWNTGVDYGLGNRCISDIMFTKWFEFCVSVHVLQYEFWVSKLLFTHKRTTFLFLYYPKINTSAECTSIILCIHVTMKVCLNIHLHTPARSKYPARQIKFLRQLVFYGVSLLTVNV